MGRTKACFSPQRFALCQPCSEDARESFKLGSPK
jgi:hypothetical protein